MRAVMLVLLMAGQAAAAGPPAVLTAEQARRRKQGGASWRQAQADWKAGRQAEALAAQRRVVAAAEAVDGPESWQAYAAVSWLATWEVERGGWKEAAGHRERMWRILAVLHGKDHWRAVDGWWAWKEALAQAGRAPARREALARAGTLNAEASALYRKGQGAKAVEAARESVRLRKEILGERHPDHATSLHNLAGLLRIVGEYKEALPLQLRANELREGLLGERHPFYATGLSNMALLHRDMGDLKAAFPLFRQARTILWDAQGPRHPDFAAILNNLAVLHKDLGDYEAALPLYRQALRLAEEVLGRRHAAYAQALSNLALLFQAMGDHKAALPLHLQALKTREGVLGRRHPDYAASLNALAGLYREMGDTRAAFPPLRQALKLREEVLGKRHPDYAQSLSDLALLHKEEGDLKAALALQVQARKALEDASGRRHPHYVTALGNLAALHTALGDHRAALPLHQEAVKLSEEILGKHHRGHALSLNNLAMLRWQMGDAKSALALTRRTLMLTREALGERHPGYATLLSNLALMHQNVGDLKAALPLSDQALKLREEVLGERHPGCAISLNNLAALHLDLGDHKAALPLAQRALRLRAEVLGEGHPHYAVSLNTLAMAHRAAGAHKAALPPLTEALKVTEAALGKRHPQYAKCQHNLAGLHLEMGGHEAALALSEGALTGAFTDLRDNAAVQSDRQQLAAAEALRHRLDLRLSLPDGRDLPLAAEHALAWKGSLLLRQQRRRLALRLAGSPEASKAGADLQAVTRQLAALRHGPGATRERLEALEAERDEAEARLAKVSEEFRLLRASERPSAEALSRSLPEGAVLVDYFFYWHQGLLDGDGRPRPERRLAAFIHRRGRQTARLGLGGAVAVEEAVSRWLSLLRKARQGDMPAAALKRLVWSPLERHLDGARVILISPDGVLGTVPFAALPGRKSGSYLIEDVALAGVAVPQAIPDMLRPVKKEDRLGPSLLLVSDVDYEGGASGARSEDGARSAPLGIGRRWERLPATSAEGAAVGKAFKARFEGGAVRDLTKGGPTKTAVRGHLGGVRYAHFATHGYFAPEAVRSALGTRKELAVREHEASGWHPLLLSGLALAGANKEPGPGEEDGILTALEVSEMDLSKLELAVLSACETGLGKVAAGEGIMGMQRAFQVAGARSVIASLWSVDDRATQSLMSEFYRIAWERDAVVSRAEALRKAQLAMLREGVKRGVARGTVGELVPEKAARRAAPYYWAAFILSGDWR